MPQFSCLNRIIWLKRRSSDTARLLDMLIYVEQIAVVQERSSRYRTTASVML